MKSLWRYIPFMAVSLLCLKAVCPTFEPPPPDPLSAPSFIGPYPLLSEFKTVQGYSEASYLRWTPPQDDSLSPRSYTLLRRTQQDSTFDLLAHNIPSQISDYYDDLSRITFPFTGFDSIFYKILAVDSLGRRGDTSVACTLILSPQPQFDSLNIAQGMLFWHVLGIQGAANSRIRIWNETESIVWESEDTTGYGGENTPVSFRKIIPDSIVLKLQDYSWYYGLFVEANGLERQSLKVDRIIVQ